MRGPAELPSSRTDGVLEIGRESEPCTLERDGSRGFRVLSLTPVRLDCWLVPLSWAGFRLGVAYNFADSDGTGHYFVPSVAVRFGKMNVIDSTWTVWFLASPWTHACSLVRPSATRCPSGLGLVGSLLTR